MFGITGGGGQAELLTVPAGQCARVPESLDLVAAGGVPEVFVTAHDAMVTQATVAAGETVLVHAAGSGVGTAAVQLAHAFGASSWDVPHRREARAVPVARPRPSGTCAARDRPSGARRRDHRRAGPVDVTIDLVGGRYVEADIRAAAVRGRIVLVGVTGRGAHRARHRRDHVQAPAHPRHRAPRRGRLEEKAAATDAFTGDVVPLLAVGTVTPVIARTFTLDDADAAYDLLAADAVFGKIVLDLR